MPIDGEVNYRLCVPFHEGPDGDDLSIQLLVGRITQVSGATLCLHMSLSNGVVTMV